MKHAQPATAIATFIFFFLIFVVFTASNRSIHAQSWSAPSNAATSELGACYDRAQRFYDNTQEIYQSWLQRDLDLADDHQNTVLTIIALGTAAGAASVPGPWSLAVLAGGAVSAWAVTRYYNNVRSTARQSYSNRMNGLRNAAEAEATACEAEHLNGGDPENEADNAQYQNSGRGVNIVGGSQSIGTPQGRVTATPVN